MRLTSPVTLTLLFFLSTVMLLGFSGTAAAQSTISDIDAAEALWANRSSNSYQFNYEYADETAGRNEFITVQNGVVVLAEDSVGGTTTFNFTVEDVFADIRARLAQGAPSSGPTFDASTGVPQDYVFLNSTGGLGAIFDIDFFAFDDDPETNFLQATVTCLVGNGRIDVNMVNDSTTAAVYTLQVGSLNLRQNTVQPKSWWRSPVTGRPDGPIDVTVTRAGITIYQETVIVACDGTPVVSDPEVQFFTWCIGGNGIIFAQMANPTGVPRSYILDVGGLRRSTTAAAYGAAFRGISGRPDGNYIATIEVAGQPLMSEVIAVNC